MAPAPARIRTESLVTNQNHLTQSYASVDEAFPGVEPGLEPFGVIGIFQIRQPKLKSAGGLHLVQDTKSTEHYNTQIAKVISLGPLAFKSQRTRDDGSLELVEWPEGRWFNVGDYVRVPKYGGDRFAVPYSYEDFEIDPSNGRKEKVTVKSEVIFALFKVKDVLGRVPESAVLTTKAFLD